jgi:hypothetical protein
MLRPELFLNNPNLGFAFFYFGFNLIKKEPFLSMYKEALDQLDLSKKDELLDADLDFSVVKPAV